MIWNAMSRGYVIIIIIFIKQTLEAQITVTKLHKCAAELQSSIVKQECPTYAPTHKSQNI